MLRAWFISAALVAASSLCGPAVAQEPFRLDRAFGAPDNLTLSVNYRTRYEFQDGRFRSGFLGSDQILVERLLLGAEYGFGGLYVGAELQDSRQQLADAGTPIGTDDVNAVELLRGYIGYRTEDAFRAGDSLDVTVGRITIDAGSRRLTARNRFRNTINGFAGVHARWTGPGGDALQGFYTLPVARRPTDAASLLNNEIDIDEENINQRFWALHYTRPEIFGDLTGEIYIFGLQEEDREELQTRDRDIFTPGFRLYKDKAAGAFDYEIETALQIGQSALSTSPDAPLLDTFAQSYCRRRRVFHALS
ncbi:MAG: alginate export family protein, partial [Pseudomonadota bacterium]